LHALHPMPRPRSPWRIAATALVITCATLATVSAQRRSAPARRGPPQGPLTEMAITVAGAEYAARVDASCRLDDQATASNSRAYFAILYPWFGQVPPADQPQWRATLEIRRSASPEASDQFTFSFLDGATSATIQTVAGSPRMGSGTVQVTRQGAGARFEVEGRSREGDSVRAVITCPQFRTGEGGG
jgi:hypothetical protein